MIPMHVVQNPLQWLWKHGPFSWLHHQALSACYWIFRCRSDFLKTSFLTNRHLLLPGTIFGHTKLISCFWSAALLVIGECITSVFSMELQCLQSLHPVASPTLLASPRMCLLLMTNGGYMTIYTIYIFLSYGHFHPLATCCPEKRGFTVQQLQQQSHREQLH